MALKIIDHGTHEYQQMVKLRDDMLRRPLGLTFTADELEEEKDNMLIGAFEDESLLGCCMLVEEKPGVVRLRQMAVLNDLQGKGNAPVGYLARRHQPPVDLARRDLAVDRYWIPLQPQGEEGQVLEPEQFYIFSTRERLRIPPDVCAELVAFDATKGELRTHYAGFIDSGFGWSASDPTQGARLVLEIRTHDVPFLLEHGQPLFRIEFMRNEAEPDILYGGAGSSYQMQGLRLAKQFRM